MSSDYAIYRQLVSQLLAGEEQLPSLPSITLEIRRALSQGQASLAELARLISRDPALTALLIKYASNPLQRLRRPARNLVEALNTLGLPQVDSITMLHSVRSLFTLHSAGHKRVFLQVWERLLLQTSLCCFLARRLVALPVEQAMLVSLLSEIGSLAVLSAFRQSMGEAEQGIYQRLCDEYRGGLGVIMLRKWGVADEYVEVIRHAGDWQHGDALPLGLLDVLNLARWHTLRAQGEAALPALQSLAAYAKLPAALDFMDERGQLNLVSAHAEEIQAILDSLR